MAACGHRMPSRFAICSNTITFQMLPLFAMPIQATTRKREVVNTQCSRPPKNGSQSLIRPSSRPIQSETSAQAEDLAENSNHAKPLKPAESQRATERRLFISIKRCQNIYKFAATAILETMFPNPRGDTPTPAAELWPDIEAALDGLAELSQSVAPPTRFCAELAANVLSAVSGESAAVWAIPDDEDSKREWRPLATIPYRVATPPPAWLHDAATKHGTTIHVDRSETPKQQTTVSAAATVHVDEQPVAILHVTTGHEDSASLSRAIERILDAFAEVAAEYFAHDERRRLKHAHRTWSKVEQFIEQCHSQWSWKPTAFTLANESRTLIGCDRVTILRRRGRRFVAEAISGADSFDRRSNQVRALERLATQTAKLNELVWYGLADAAEETQHLFEAYVDSANAKGIAVAPIVKGETIPDVLLICEFFELPRDETPVRDRLALVQRHGRTAAEHSLRIERMPLRFVAGLLESIGWRNSWSRVMRWSAVCTVILAAAAAAILVQTDLEIKARGELQPDVQRRIFAPADGSIADILIERGERVDEGDLLIRMTDRQLDFDEARIAGEIQTVSTELQTVRTTRIKGAQHAEGIERENELAARETQLGQQLANLNEQLGILKRKRKALEVRSPIEGQVVAGDIRHDLDARPVKRGQRLMVVAQTNGEWVLQLRVPDERMKHVLDARDKQSQPLRVRFMLASKPGTMYDGKVREISVAADSQTNAPPTVLVTVSVQRDQIADLHVGADVAARIVCGRTSVGFAWLHNIYERIRIQFFV